MKRTIAISVIVLLIGSIYAAPRAAAQESRNAETEGNPDNLLAGPLPGEADLSPLEAAKSQYQTAEQHVSRVAIELLKQAAKKGPGALGSDRQALRDKLRPLVEESFDARQRLQQEELKSLRRRLAEIEQAVEDRAEHRSAIIKSRVDALADSAANEIARMHGVTTRGDQHGSDAPRFNQFQREGPNDGSGDPLAVSPPPTLGPTLELPEAPAGMEARVRYVQEQVEENGVAKPVTRRVIEFVKVGQTSADLDAAAAATKPASPNAPPGPTEASLSVSEAFDLDTRQRLALLELQPAQDKIDDAERALSYARKLRDKGYASELEVSSREKDLRHAAIELRRVKVKLSGIDSERAELQTAAESALAEANGEVERATAKVKVAEANVATAEAKKAQLDADVEGAKSNQAFQAKRFDRLDKLAKVEKAIDVRLVDEAEEKLHAAEAALSGAEAAAATGGADIDQAKAAVAEARAELNIAETRRRAAQARLDRLQRQTPPSDLDPLIKPGADSSETEKPLE